MKAMATGYSAGSARIGVVVLLLLIGTVGASAYAQTTKESREREALRRAQQTTQKLQQEKASLEQEKVKLEQEKAALTAKLAAATGEIDKLKKGSAEAEKRVSSLTRSERSASVEGKELRDRLTAAEKSGADLATNRSKLEQTLQDNEKRWDAERQGIKAELAQEQERGQSCERKNEQLAGIALQFLDRYEKKGAWSTFVSREPLTGLGSVETENLLQEYRERVQDNGIGKSTQPPK